MVNEGTELDGNHPKNICRRSMALRFVKRKNKGPFLCNVPWKKPTPEELRKGRHEKPHLTFVVEKYFIELATHECQE